MTGSAAEERQREALPAGPGAGQSYAWQRIQAGDEVCRENQELHGQAADLPAHQHASCSPTAQPACPGLRNQPCRAYVPLRNRTEKG